MYLKDSSLQHSVHELDFSLDKPLSGPLRKSEKNAQVLHALIWVVTDCGQHCQEHLYLLFEEAKGCIIERFSSTDPLDFDTTFYITTSLFHHRCLFNMPDPKTTDLCHHLLIDGSTNFARTKPRVLRTLFLKLCFTWSRDLWSLWIVQLQMVWFFLNKMGDWQCLVLSKPNDSGKQVKVKKSSLYSLCSRNQLVAKKYSFPYDLNKTDRCPFTYLL